MELDRRVGLPLLIVALGVIAVAIVVATRPSVEARPPRAITPLVEVIEVQPREFQLVVRGQGTVVPRTESDLVPQVSGEVVWVSPSLVSGGFFDEDELLVRIDPADYQADLESARAALARARSEFARAKTELARQRKLADQNVASQARIDDTENAYRVAEASQREARVRLERAERDLARTELRAPYLGRVRSKQVDVGQFVNRGSAVATLYATDYAEVRLPLPDRELKYLDLPLAHDGFNAPPDPDAQQPATRGPEVNLLAEFAGEARRWSGRVVRTEGEIDPKSRMLHVVARVEDPYGAGAQGSVPLAVGLFVEAEILGRHLQDVYVLPRAALQGDSSQRVVYVVDSEDRLRFRAVELVRAEREQVVVRGLVAGDRVSVSAGLSAVDGMSVRVANAPDEGAKAAAAEPSNLTAESVP